MIQDNHTPTFTAHHQQQLLAKTDFQALIDRSIAGYAPTLDYAIRHYLHSFSLQKVKYGLEVPFENRHQWRLQGDDVESGNEVFEYLVLQGHEASELFDFAGESLDYQRRLR